MVVGTPRNTGKVKEVNYAEDEGGDYNLSNGIEPTPHQHPGNKWSPNNETGTDLGLETGVKSVRFQLQEDSNDEEEYELSHGKKGKPRKPVTPTTKGKRKGKARKLDNVKLPTQVEARRLDNLFDKLPTEVIYIIFTFLHPLDLLWVARTNRMLRSHLMSKASARIWKAAGYTTNPPVPKCPSDQTEPQWTRLLFTTECSNCPRDNIHSIIWAHRLRLCHNCDRAGVVLIHEEDVEWTFPDIEGVPSLLNLLPWSMSASEKYYKISDIQKIGAEWTRIKKEGTKKELEEFTKRRFKEVTEIRDTRDSLAKSWAKWEQDQASQKRKDKKRKKKARKKEILARMEALGHHPSDVRSRESMMTIAAFGYTTPLTESNWNMMRAKLELTANQAKPQRLKRERKRVVKSRRGVAETLVRECYTNSDIRPAFRSGSCVQDILSSKIFQDVINRSAEVSVTREDFQEALDTVPEVASNASREIQLHLLQIMVSGGAPDIDTSPTLSNFDALLLATATFFCNATSNALPHCGAGDLDEHCCTPDKKKPKFYCLLYDHRAGSAVAALLAVAGLELGTTPEQMDEKDLRFCCSGCSNGSSRSVMSWRDAARHARTVKHGQDSGWELLSFEDTEVIKRRERANIEDARLRFWCDRCSLPSVFRRKELEEHLTNHHSITGLLDPTAEFRTKSTVPPEPLTVTLNENRHSWTSP